MATPGKPRRHLAAAAAGAALLLIGGLLAPYAAHAAPLQTVCTLTINSPDEKAAFARHLPAERFRWLELVEPGRPDWLASACRSAIACDVLVISGHYDGSSVFFSDRQESQDHLPVADLERLSCSESCPALFAQLKEVHLYGCNTLNPRPLDGTTAELVRQLVREGGASAATERRLMALGSDLGESSLQRMRRIFKEVPVIYGFPSVAPLGPVAGATLNSYFREHGPGEIGSGRPGRQLLEHFAPFGMQAVRGTGDRGAESEARREICLFSDERVDDAQRIAAMHLILRRPMAEVLPHLERIEAQAALLRQGDRSSPAARSAWASLHDDLLARLRFLDHARASNPASRRARLLDVAEDLGWLTTDERHNEWLRLLRDLLAQRDLGLSDVDLVCARSATPGIDELGPTPAEGLRAAHAAIRACLGSAADRSRILKALSSEDTEEVLVAQAYLRHRPLRDPAEAKRVAQDIAQMPASPAQVQAIEALGRHAPLQRELLETLLQLYARTDSWAVQAAIAGILIRADTRTVPRLAWLKTLEDARLPAPEGDNLVDILIRRFRLP